MKTVLTVGAIICGVMGVFFILFFVSTIRSFAESLSENIHDSRDLSPLITSVAFALLTFTPVIMLTRFKGIQISDLRLTLIGLTELIVIGLFLAMVFPSS